MMDAPTERVVDKAIKYGAVIAEVSPPKMETSGRLMPSS